MEGHLFWCDMIYLLGYPHPYQTTWDQVLPLLQIQLPASSLRRQQMIAQVWVPASHTGDLEGASGPALVVVRI